MKYLLDTNTWIALLNGTSNSVVSELKKLDKTNVFLCSIVKAELFFGALKSKQVEKNLEKLSTALTHFTSLSFDDDCAFMYGLIREELERKGTPIGPNDLLIASIALVNNCILITNNSREFSRVQGLTIQNWI
ncbi:MAG: type II toxin-antitoxin system VapC family toxin [Candidatus Kapabacteria bacterium]|nr:type II toxin-antitoxin system VapC family toxin [Candidatus Kapabacteria bacterium]MBX7155935.1 type II toxin-antitoxin system VapC family toxin [Bacteroidota bacterium]